MKAERRRRRCCCCRGCDHDVLVTAMYLQTGTAEGHLLRLLLLLLPCWSPAEKRCAVVAAAGQSVVLAAACAACPACNMCVKVMGKRNS